MARIASAPATPRPGSASWLRLVQSPVFIRLLALATFFAVWQVGGSLSGSLSVPSVSETAVAWWKLVTTGELIRALWLSMTSMLIGLLIAVVVGIATGLMMGWYRNVEAALDIYLSLLLVLPMMALIPIIIAVLGLTMAARVCVVFLFAVVTVIINTVAGVKDVDPAMVEMARSFGATNRQLFLRILLPGSMQSIVAGIRLSTGRAFVGMISAEMLVTAVGFGNLILEYSAKFKPEFVFATLITVIAIALVVAQLLRRAEQRLLSWMYTHAQ